MYKIVPFRAALVMVCVIAFSVCLGSCDEIEKNNPENENPLSFVVDTNGVSYTIKPLLDWNSTLADAERFMAENYPDWKVVDDGTLQLDTTIGRWCLTYEYSDLRVVFIFDDREGNEFSMFAFDGFGRKNVKLLEDQVLKAGFKYKGHVEWDAYLDEVLTSVYLSADEELEIQLVWQNSEAPEYYGISFQQTDREDLNHVIDESSVTINFDTKEGSYSLTPFMDWDASVADVRKFMEDNYPDWEPKDEGELIKDTISGDSIQCWVLAYNFDSLQVFYYFEDEEGGKYSDVQYVYYSSPDITTIKQELTRNGIVYAGRYKYTYEGLYASYIYAPISKEYVVALSSWDLYGGCWCLGFAPFEDLDNLVSE